MLDWVVTHQCDLGLAAAPIEHAAARSEMMPAVRYVAVMPDGHRLARRRVLRPRDFAGQPFVTLGPTTPSRHRIDDVFARHGVSRVLSKEIRRLASRSIAVGGNPSRRSPRVLQRAQSLSHVMEFAERRLEPAGVRGIRPVLLRVALAAAAQMHDEQNGDDAESGNQGGDHHG